MMGEDGAVTADLMDGIVDGAPAYGLDFTRVVAHAAATESLMLDGTVVRVAPRGPWTASVMVFDAGGELSARASVSALGAADPAATILAVAAAMAGSAGNGRL